MTAFAVIYDACVLHPPSLRDLLIRLALTGKVRARWTDEILDETFRSILARRSDLSMANLERTRELMNASVPDCRVTGHMPLIGGLTLPDPDDRHVLAAAIVAGAQVIVTFNLKDFPRDLLTPFTPRQPSSRSSSNKPSRSKIPHVRSPTFSTNSRLRASSSPSLSSATCSAADRLMADAAYIRAD
jgi:predicted nucleic acid-binding protein